MSATPSDPSANATPPLASVPGETEAARRSRERHARDRSESAIAAFPMFATLDPAAAQRFRNTLIESNPRLAWALTGLLPIAHPAKETSRSAQRSVNELEEDLSQRGWREKTPLDGSLLSFSAQITHQGAHRSLGDRGASTPSALAANLLASGAVLPARSAALGVGSRSVFRLALRAANDRIREWRSTASGRFLGSKKEAAALAAVVPWVFRGPFSDGDCAALARAILGPQHGPSRIAWTLDQAPLIPNATDAQLKERIELHNRAWNAVAAELPAPVLSQEVLLPLLSEALAHRRISAARLAGQALARISPHPMSAGLGFDTTRDSNGERARPFSFGRLADGRHAEARGGPLVPVPPERPLDAGPFALSLAQGLGWEWLRDAGLAPSKTEMDFIAREAPLADFEAIALWLAETHRDATRRSAAADASAKKSAATPPAWLGWGPDGPPKGALSVEACASLAPMFGGDPAHWLALVRNAVSHKSRAQTVADLASAARCGDGFQDALGKTVRLWQKTLACATHDTHGAREAWLPLLDEAIAAPGPRSLPANAWVPVGTSELTPALFFRGWGNEPTFNLIVEIAGRAWLSEWIGPQKAWASFAPPMEPRADEIAFQKRRAEHARPSLLAIAFAATQDKPLPPDRMEVVRKALSLAGGLDFWSAGGAAGEGPLREAMLLGRRELSAIMAASGENRRLSAPAPFMVRASDLRPDGRFSGLTRDSRPAAVVRADPSDADESTLGFCGLALLCGQPDFARMAKPAARAGFDRDLAQLQAWAKIRAARPEAEQDLHVAIAQGEAISLSSLKVKKAPKNPKAAVAARRAPIKPMGGGRRL